MVVQVFVFEFGVDVVQLYVDYVVWYVIYWYCGVCGVGQVVGIDWFVVVGDQVFGMVVGGMQGVDIQVVLQECVDGGWCGVYVICCYIEGCLCGIVF